MRALVTGATGFIGRRLLQRLDRGVVLSRNADAAARLLPGAEVHRWESEVRPPPVAAFENVDAVFHLAGDPVAEGRWTAKKKEQIKQSRVLGTRQLVETLYSLPRKPAVLVSGSAVGFYGDRGDDILDESSTPGTDFLADVCLAWEAEARRAEAFGVRVVTVRTGFVLGNGGALAKLLPPFRLGVGGRLGAGKQWMSWIHVDDEVGLLLHAASQASISGPLNATAPEPVTNLEFTRVLGRTLRRPTVFPMPAFALGFAFGAEKATMLLASQRVLPRAAMKAGYSFQHPVLEAALHAVLNEKSPRR
jgi:uncharacterized protein